MREGSTPQTQKTHIVAQIVLNIPLLAPCFFLKLRIPWVSQVIEDLVVILGDNVLRLPLSYAHIRAEGKGCSNAGTRDKLPLSNS